MKPIIIYTFPVLIGAPLVWADISLGKLPLDVPQPPAVYHTDLLASNAVHAIFREIRSVPVVSLDAAPSSQEVAVFEVKQNLAYRRYDRMGDGALQVGKRFAVSLASDIPGQDAALGQKIRAMKPGDEALMNIDHIYVFREEGNENVRACTRFAGIQPQKPAPLPENAQQAPATPPSAEAAPAESNAPERLAPQPLQPAAQGSARSVESRITIEPDGKGGMRTMKVEVHREWASDGTQKVRKFINNVEVDPQTDQPLTIPAAAAEPQPAPQAESSAPAAPAQPEPAAPAPESTSAAPQQAAQQAEPNIPEPKPTQEEGF